MKIMILGPNGMLGMAMLKALEGHYMAIPMDRKHMDITNSAQICEGIIIEKPEVVINCAGFTNVDGCEKERELAFAVNGEALKNIALICKEEGIKLVYISTDYIFDGEKGAPYVEDDFPNPVNIYGSSKLLGETYVGNVPKAFLIIRTQWLFGKGGKNFVDSIMKQAAEKRELSVVNDQWGSPTYTKDLAEAIKTLIDFKAEGIYHIANSGATNWYLFAQEILELAGLKEVKVTPIPSEACGRPAKRPKFSVLDCTKFQRLVGKPLRPWKDALEDYVNSLIR